MNPKLSKLHALSRAIKTSFVLLAVILCTSRSLGEINISSLKVAPLFAFPGSNTLEIVLSNSGGNAFAGNVQVRLYQLSSATLMPVGPAKPWKKIEMFSSQRTIETVSVDYPSISSETLFQIQFIDDARKPLGKVTVHVLPPDLLKQLSTLCGKNPVGIYDPENQLKPMLAKLKVGFEDLEDDAQFNSFHGNLLFVGPFSTPEKLTENLKGRVSAKAKQSCSVVWMLPPDLQVPFASVFVARDSGAEVRLHDSAFRDLSHSASAQFTLLRSAQLALDPGRLSVSYNRPIPK